MPVQGQQDGASNEDKDIPVRTIIFLSSEWTEDGTEGVSTVNRSIARSLTGYDGIQVHCATIKHLDRCAENESNVHLFGLFDWTKQDFPRQVRTFNETPEPVWTKSGGRKRIPDAKFIVGHFPGTAEAALRLRDAVYPGAKVVLFFHVVPDDIEWLADGLPFAVPKDDDLVRLAETANVVYSVTGQVYGHFQARFVNRARKAIDHRAYLPQCSKQVFEVAGSPSKKGFEEEEEEEEDGELKVFVLSRGETEEDWQGLDIAACAISKVATILRDRGGPPVSLTVAGVGHAYFGTGRATLDSFAAAADMRIEYKAYKDAREQYLDLARHRLCLVPTRAEPFGSVGLLPISAGVPTLVAEDSYLASTLKRLTVDSNQYLVPTTKAARAVKQDAGLWKDRVLELVADRTVEDRTQQLKLAAKGDEVTIQTHDNLIAYCLSGIKLKVEVTHLKFTDHTTSSHQETVTRKRLSLFLLTLLKQSWRLKRHPLADPGDQRELLPGIKPPPFAEITDNITDKIEDMGRRIVDADEPGGSLVVYCPGRKALRDLWAAGDSINRAIEKVVFKDDRLRILQHFRLTEATTKLSIPGPDYLRHNEEMLKATS